MGIGNNQLHRPAACCSVGFVLKCLQHGGTGELYVSETQSKGLQTWQLALGGYILGLLWLMSSTTSQWGKRYRLDEVFSDLFMSGWVDTNSSQTDEKKQPKSSWKFYSNIQIHSKSGRNTFQTFRGSYDQSKIEYMRRESLAKKIVIIELLEMDAQDHLK